MPSDSAPKRLFALEIDYTNSAHETLTAGETGVEGAKAIAQLFSGLGYEEADTAHLRAAAPRDIVDAIEDWSTSAGGPGRAEQLVLYVAGHGKLHGRRYYLMAASSPNSPPWSSRNAVNIDQVAEHLLNAPARSCVVLLDTCGAGFGANQIVDHLRLDSEDRANASIDIGVLASSLPLQSSYAGRFAQELVAALTEGSKHNHWRPGTRDVTLLELRDELRDRIDEQVAFTTGQTGLRLPNLAYQPHASDVPVLLNDLLARLPPADREHFLAKAAGADAADVGWFFSGRRSATRRLLNWLGAHPEGGVYLVTGSPGAGKSAFLGRLAVMADRASQAACQALGMFDDPDEPRPQAGLFDAVVHARNLDAARIALALGDQLGIDVSQANRPEVALRAHLLDSGRAATILIDAIDEVDAGQHDGVTIGIVRAIGSLPNCRVVAGSRRDRSGTFQATDDDLGPLLEAMRPASAPWEVDDLDLDPEADADIRGYIDARLAGGWPNPDRRTAAAAAVAEQANRLFLYARFALKVLEARPETLVDETGWAGTLPGDTGRAGLRQVFDEDLARYGTDSTRIRELLRPLAFGRGKGLPQRQIWPELATELAAPDLGGSGRTYVGRDIGFVIREAAWYLTETTVDGEAVFRLYHQAIADALREDLIDAD